MERTAHSMLKLGGYENGSTEEKHFSCEKDEETFQRMEARDPHQYRKVPSVRRAHPRIPRMQGLRLLQG